MTHNVNAIYEGGVFRPTGETAPPLPDGAEVQLTVEPVRATKAADIFALGAAVYDGLREEEVAEVERIATDRTRFFTPPAESNGR